MTDSQDEMNRTLRFTTTPEERKIIRDRLNLFTNPLGKRGAVASLGGGATTKSKSNETGNTAKHSMCYQSFRQPCSIPLKSKLIGEQNGY